MNADVKTKWVAALRSGNYRQTRGQLKYNDAHCCLGVLCEVAIAERVIESFMSTSAYLPKDVQAWADLPKTYGAEVEIDGSQSSLPIQNDSGRTFAEIANAIEAQL